MSPAIELIAINKSFGAVHANRDVDLTVERGTIHGIVGENGAGKSTLMSILYGFYEADSGEIRVGGKPIAIRSPADAIACRHRHGPPALHAGRAAHASSRTSCSAPRAAPCCASARRRCARSWRGWRAITASRSTSDAIVGDLSVGLQQRVEILKALYRGADILILDEPTAVLTPPEADALFELLRALKEQGKTVILITHKLREIMAVTDRVSVMRRGEMVATLETADTSPPELAELMVGRRVLLRVEKAETRCPARRCSRSTTSRSIDARGVLRVANVSFTVHAGEIVGIAGVAGNGQSELAGSDRRHAPAGARHDPSRGADDIRPREHNPHRMRQLGLLHVPEDRLRMGLVPAFPAFESAILGFTDDPQLGRGPLLDHRPHDRRSRGEDGAVRRAPAGAAAEDVEILRRQPAEDRAGARDRAPSQGAARRPADARRRYRRDRVHPPPPDRACATPASRILLVSVELDEIMNLSDRILAMCGGQITGERKAVRDRRAGSRPAHGRRHRRGSMMQPRLTLVTLGVADLARSRAFYEAWGWKASSASQPECRVLPGERPRARVSSAAPIWPRMPASRTSPRALPPSRSPTMRARKKRPTRSMRLRSRRRASPSSRCRMFSGAAIRAISPIPTGISGKSPGIRPSRSTSTATCSCRIRQT